MRLAGRCDGLQNLEKTPHFVHRCFGHNFERPPGAWRGICWRTERAGRAEWDAISRSSFSFRCSRCLTSGTIAGKTKGYAYVRRTNQPGPQRRMLVRQRQEVQEVPPRIRRAPAEHVRAGLRTADRASLKSAADIEGIKRSAAINIGVLDYVAERIGPGTTTEEVDRWVHDYTVEHGGIPADLNYEATRKACAPPSTTWCATASL